MPIAKGDSARARELGLKGGGRPKGSVDQKWFNLQHWHEVFMAALEKIDNPVIQAQLALKGWELLLGKRPGIPESPDESVKNATTALKELQEATDAVNRSDGGDFRAMGSKADAQALSGSNQASLGEGDAAVDVHRSPAEVPKSMGESSASKT